MKATVDRAAFKRALTILRPLCGGRSPSLALGHVRMEVKRGKLLVSGTNLETQATVRMKADAHLPGVVVLPHKTLAPLVKSGVGTVSFESMDTEEETQPLVEFKNGAATARILGLDPKEYPKLRTRRARAYAHTFEVQDFARLLGVTLPFTAKDSGGRFAQNAVLFEVDGTLKSKKGMLAASTDGRRLGRGICAFEPPEQDANEHLPAGASLPQILVPRNAAVVLQRCIGKKDEGPLRFWFPRFDEECVAVEFGDIEVSTQLVDGEFPRYRRVVPDSTGITWTAALCEVMQAVNVVYGATAPENRAIRLTLKGKAIVVEARTKEGVEARADFPVEVVTATKDGRSTGVNPDYFLDALEAVRGDRVQVGWNEGFTPIRIEFGDGALGVIMPINLDARGWD